MINYRLEFFNHHTGHYEEIKSFGDIEDAITAGRAWRDGAQLLAGGCAETRIVRTCDEQGAVVLPNIRLETRR
jgi:hypothetical protein